VPDRASIWYVYGIVPAQVASGPAPAGLDDAPVESMAESDVAAVVSRLDASRYAPEVVERGTAEMQWLGPRAVAHDRVLTWASDHGPVVPLPMFSLFSSDVAVRRMLRQQGAKLRSALARASEGREYALRVYRLDDELRAVAAELSPRLAELERAAASATPGQRYLLERKLDTERKAELRAIGSHIASEVFDSLRARASGAVQGKLVVRSGSTGAEAPLVLDAAFLVAPAQLEEFRRELTALISRHASRGFRFDFTGPWPPYHFVQTSVEAG
jgi:gas vesicle protein GvpL/GvpF